MDGESEDENYMPLSEDEVSLGDKEFIVPEDPVKQECLVPAYGHCKNPEEKVATTSS